MDTAYKSVITAQQLLPLLDSTRLVLIDCRFDLADTEAGRAAYLKSHVPAAVYVHLDEDLSGPPHSDHGRHPLPAPDRLNRLFSELGVTDGSQVVCYDASSGMIAARLWWMLRYMGHATVAVLDGGWPAWIDAAYAIASALERRPPTHFSGQPAAERLVTLNEVSSAAWMSTHTLLDARDPLRYRGQYEPIDPCAGHIPGAVNHCWQRNLNESGAFADVDTLRQRFSASVGALPDATIVHYCGSGVSACHNVLAQIRAGLPEPKLYCGSWSEWCSDPARPMGTGEQA